MDAITDNVDEAAAAPDAKPVELKGEKLEDMLAEARTRFEYANDIDNDNRERQADDTRFVWVKGAQWPEDAMNTRVGWDQPCLEASQLTQFIKQVVNDQRQSRPGVIVSPVSGDASKETAKLLQGMVRHIEVDSQAEAAYDQAYEHAVTGGRGFIRVLTAYEDGATFNQKLLIKRVQDPLTVFPDPDYREPDGSDMGWCFVIEKVGRKKFEKMYPKADALDWDGAGVYSKWFDGEDDVYIADYFRRVKTPRVVAVMTDGRVAWKDEIPPEFHPLIKREREAEDFTVEWLKLAGGQQVLETLEWPGKIIPVVIVPGNEIYVEGKRQFQGLIRRARDTQMMYNYLISAAAERVALAPKAPWVMAEGQDEGNENQWKDANKTPYSRLIYKPVTIGDQLAPPPQRQSPVQAEMGLLNHAQMCKDDIKSILGQYEASLGQRGNETSGRAILARERQSDNATFDFVDNLGRAIAVVGRICIECIGTVYDTQRVVGIVNPDDTKGTETINAPQVDPMTGALAAIRKNDVSVGTYAVTVNVGPTYATKRQESSDSIMAFIQAFPAAAQVTGDLIAKSQDWADADVIGDRLRFLLPPEIRQAEDAKKEGQAPIPPEIQQAMQQKDQQLQQMQQGLQQLQGMLAEAQKGEQAKMAEIQGGLQLKRETAMGELALKREIATAEAQTGAQTELEKAQIQAQATIEKARIDAQVKLTIAGMQPAGVAGVPGELATDPEGADESQESQVLLALAQAVQSLADATAAPRAMDFQTDAAGNIVGGISQVVQ